MKITIEGHAGEGKTRMAQHVRDWLNKYMDKGQLVKKDIIVIDEGRNMTMRAIDNAHVIEVKQSRIKLAKPNPAYRSVYRKSI